MEKSNLYSGKNPFPDPAALVLCHRYGKTFFRRRPVHYQDACSSSQQLQRGRMIAVVNFYRTVRHTPIPAIWQKAAMGQGCSGYNLFISTNINAFNKEGEIFDYANLSISTGKISLPANITAKTLTERDILLSWEDTEGTIKERSADKLQIAAIYDQNPFEVVFCATEGASRGQQQAIIATERPTQGGMHMYVFLQTKNKTIIPLSAISESTDIFSFSVILYILTLVLWVFLNPFFSVISGKALATW